MVYIFFVFLPVMWKYLFFLFAGFFLVHGCEVYELDSYPTLSGTYIVSWIRIDSSNTYYGTEGNATIYDGTVETCFGYWEVGKEEIAFSENLFYMGHRIVLGTNQWEESFYYDIMDGYFSGWRYLSVDYYYPVNLIIEEDGLESLLLKSPTQYSDSQTRVDMWFYLTRIGP